MRYKREDTEFFGQILYFLSMTNESYHGKVLASVQEYEVVKEIGPVKGFFYVLNETDKEDLIDVDTSNKIFCVPFSGFEFFVIKLCTAFDHS